MKTNRFFTIVMFLILTAGVVKAQEIFEAVKTNDLAKVKGLIEADRQLVYTRDTLNRTPLHWACRGVHYQLMKYLVNAGSDVNARDLNNITPLISVTARNHLKAVTYLLDHGAKIEEADNLQKAPILYALSPESKKILQLLLKRGASLEVENDRQRTPLILACREGGSIDIVKLLVENGANINAKDRFGATALSLAAWRGFEDLVNYLLDQGAEIETSGKEGLELLSYATDKRLWKLYEAMIAKGGDPFILAMMDKPVLHHAAAGGSAQISEDLIKRSFQVNARDYYGWAPLHYASYLGRTEVAAILIQQGADVNIKTPLGESPYYLAQTAHKEEILKLLASKGASGDLPAHTPLSGPYFGQLPPGESLQLFAPGIISRLKGGHSDIVFSPDGRQACWTEWNLTDVGYSQGCTLWYSQEVNGYWSLPEKIQLKGDTPFWSTDGRRIFFLASLPLPPENKEVKGIWYYEPTKDGLGTPQYLDFDIAGNELYWQFSFDQNQNLFFPADNGRLFRSVYKNGIYQPRELLSDLFGPDFRGGSPFIAADGSYFIFSSMELPGSLGSLDLYIGFKKPDGSWTKPVNMGPSVNSSSDEILPMVSRDGKYLFIRTERNSVPGVYWIDAKIIDKLKAQAKQQ